MENAETQEDQMTEETEQKQAPPAINQETPDTLTAGANTEADVVVAAEQQVFCDTCGAANPLTARYCQHCAALMPFRHITGMLVGPTLLAKRPLNAKRTCWQNCCIQTCRAFMTISRKMIAPTW